MEDERELGEDEVKEHLDWERASSGHAYRVLGPADAEFPSSRTAMNSDDEAYILMLLSDGNLPTGKCQVIRVDRAHLTRLEGSFVASAGLESYVTHGFLTHAPDGSPKDKFEGMVD